MFVDRAKWAKHELRQGDVLAGVSFPFASVLQQHFLAEPRDRKYAEFPQLKAKARDGDASLFTGQVAMVMSSCAVLTQCCELVPRAHGKITLVKTISVCRLVPLSHSMKTDPKKLESIRSNSDPRKQGGYKNYFYYGSGDMLGPEELMADFSQTTCIPNTEFPEALSNKVLQLDDRTRMKFKIKLGVFNAKPTDEEIVANILDPWAETTEIAVKAIAAAVPPESSAAAEDQGHGEAPH
jgi:hypothetical protein